jgi:hypothetical protein
MFAACVAVSLECEVAALVFIGLSVGVARFSCEGGGTSGAYGERVCRAKGPLFHGSPYLAHFQHLAFKKPSLLGPPAVGCALLPRFLVGLDLRLCPPLPA